MCVIAATGVAPCQCFSPGANQTTSPGRISAIGPPSRCAQPQPAVTMSIWPSAWHTHPLGQMLIVTAGCGWAQREGGPIAEIRPGDVVWFAPGEKHWHGATPVAAMTHIAIQERLGGKMVEWLEPVSDAQYRRGPA